MEDWDGPPWKIGMVPHGRLGWSPMEDWDGPAACAGVVGKQHTCSLKELTTALYSLGLRQTHTLKQG